MLTRTDFWSRFAPDPNHFRGCWLWTGARNAEGYGYVRVSGVLVQVHILAWETFYGKPVPEGKLLRHSCDNPPCGNPRHLTPGEHGDNLRDQWFRGRRKARTGARRKVQKALDV